MISTGTHLGHRRAPFSLLFVCGGGVLLQGPKGELAWTFVPEVTLKEVRAGHDGPCCSPAVEPRSSLPEMQSGSVGSSASSSSSNPGVQRPLADVIFGSSGLQPQAKQPDSSSPLLDRYSNDPPCSVFPTLAADWLCVSQEEGKILVRRAEETKRASAMHGLSR